MSVTINKSHSQITESSRSCVCGHVLEDANRYIGGKRFSGTFQCCILPVMSKGIEILNQLLSLLTTTDKKQANCCNK